MGVTNLVCIRQYFPAIWVDELQTLKRRLPPTTVSGGLFNAKQFKSPAYVAYTAFGVVAFLGLFTGKVHTLREIRDPRLTYCHACSTHFYRRKRALTRRPGESLLLPRLYNKRWKCRRSPNRRRPC